MSFDFGIRRPIATSRVSSGGGGRGGGDDETFVDDYWQSGVTAAYQDLQFNSDLNPGQKAILESEENSILEYLYEQGEDYNPDAFLDFLETSLTDDGRYQALSETFSTYAKDMQDVWDHASGGDGLGRKKFLGVIYGS